MTAPPGRQTLAGWPVGAAYMPPGNPAPPQTPREGYIPPLRIARKQPPARRGVGDAAPYGGLPANGCLPGMPGPPPCRYRPFVFCIVGRGLDPSAAYRRREPQKPLRPASRPPPLWGEAFLASFARAKNILFYKISRTVSTSPSTLNLTLFSPKSSVYTRSGSCW